MPQYLITFLYLQVFIAILLKLSSFDLRSPMILQTSPLEKPHISAKELAKYPFLTPAARVAMLRDHKYKNEFRAGYYSGAEHAIRRALFGNAFDESLLLAELDKIQAKDPENKKHRDRAANNRGMVQCFLDLCDLAAPMPGVHSKPRSASMELDGVTVSIRPELLTENLETGFFAFIKFYFFKGTISTDAADILLLLLIKYGQAHPRPGLRFDLEHTKLVDCYGRSVICGHNVPRHREQQLSEALRDICRVWPTIQPKPVKGFLYEGPGG